MDKKVLNYHVLVNADKRTGTKEPCYTAYVPVLGIATDGISVEDAIKNVKDLIEFHLESLTEEGEEIETESIGTTFVANTEVHLPRGAVLAIQ